MIHKVNKVKPGKDYFNGNFYWLMVIWFYGLFYWRHMIEGEKSETTYSETFNTEETFTTNHFSAG